MRLLSLDIGMRRTGVAFAEEETGIVMVLDTIEHTSTDQLVTRVTEIAKTRGIGLIVVGLPILLGGEEGSQAKYVREVIEMIRMRTGLPVSSIDERYTNESSPKSVKDAKAACEIIEIALQKRQNGIDI
ncbi:MAG: Holliday junction resolvase RuvX [Candidatus Peribacteraceae bacterium]